MGLGEAVCTGKHGRLTKNLSGSFGSRISNNDQIKTFEEDIGLGSDTPTPWVASISMLTV